MGTWLNADGLYLEFGTTKATPVIAGEFRSDGSKRWIEVKFDYTNLPAYTASEDTFTIITDKVALPKGATVEAVELFAYTDLDSAGDGALLSVGTVDLDRSSNLDADSLVDVMTQAEFAAGGTNVAGWVGTLVGGAELTTAKLLTWTVTVESATAGEAALRVYYSVS